MKQLLLICALLIAFTSCVDTPKPQTAIQQPDEENPPMLVAFGTVGDGTSMHSLELINQKGDTLYFVYENNAVGGLAVGDSVNVEYKNIDGEYNALYIVNFSTLSHRWVSSDEAGAVSFTFGSDGSFSSEGFDKHYLSWHVIGGDIFFELEDHTDKYAIDLLTEDSLVLFSLEDGTTLSFSRAD